MSSDIPPAPPEAEVIRLARSASGMSAESAAVATRKYDRKGVSATYWRDVERGQGGRRGERVPVRASDRALAAMARVVGVEPQQLTGAGRGEAAKVLEEILRRDSTPRSLPQSPVPEADPDELGAWERAVWSEVSDSLARYGSGATGAQVFPGSAVEASVWDTRKLPDREAKVRLIAKLRAISDESSAESRAG